MKIPEILLAIAFSFAMSNAFTQDLTLVRTPSISPDGKQISFTYQGDIWTQSIDGGTARRLTVHESYESNPQWSPDGKQLVFQGSRLGNNDIFVMNADGGRTVRLTYHSTSDDSPQWGSNGNIYFNSRRAFLQVEREREVMRVSALGGTPQRFLNAVGLSPAPSNDGKFMAIVRGNCRVSREAYQGPANRNIWIYNVAKKSYHQITDFKGQDIDPNWGGNKLYYLSTQNGRYNLYRQSISAEGTKDGVAEALTKFKDEGITYFDVSIDGTTVVFERGESLYLMGTESGAVPRKITINVSKDDRLDPLEHKKYTKEATEFALSPNEKQMAFIVRGELFVKLNNKDKKRAVQLTDHPFRDKEPVWVNDSTLIFSSDRNGNFEMYSLTSNQTGADLSQSLKLSTRQLTQTSEEEENLKISPDRQKIAFRRGRGKLIVADIGSDGSLSNEKTLLDGWDSPEGVAWSPDSKWLAYGLSDLNFNQEIYIHPIDQSRDPVNVSLHPRSDYSPVWSPDGSKLGFLSIRNNGDSDVWFVWLKKSDWEKTKREWEDEDMPDENEKDKNGKKKDDEDSTKTDIPPVVIDFEDIHHRIIQVTRLAGNERNLAISKNGETFYFTTNGGGRAGSPDASSLMSAQWDGSELSTLIPKIDLNDVLLDQKGKSLYVLKSGGTLSKIGVPEKKGMSSDKGSKEEALPFEAAMAIDHAAERKQIFDEAWRRLRDGFYDPEFHGQDWSKLKKRYYQRCIQASTYEDFRTYANEMLGQLNASHMGIYGGELTETQKESTGLLGIEFESVSNGLKITHIVPATPADRIESKLNVGETITSINGNTLTPTTNFYKFLNGKRNERVLLTVNDNSGQSREVIIRPTSFISNELYEAWVKERKALTEKYSNGRLGYIHIQGMNWTSFERFERELTASGLGKDGIVIDVRFNGGGWTTDMLMAVLNVRQHAFTIPRGAAKDLEKEKGKFTEHYPFGERLPLSSWTKPSVAICNENSYSNAEIFSHAFKTLGLGTLVGRPTFGAVISTGGANLLNGAYVRMPFRGWYVKGSNMNMEHGPAVPDIEVFNAPDSKANGNDPQLKRAVDELLKQIEKS